MLDHFLKATCIVLLVAPLAFSQTPATPAQTANGSPANRQRVAERLTQALTDLIPGDYAADSNEIKLIDEIVAAFLAGEQTRTETAIEKLEKLDSAVPPRELLFAGLAYSSNNLAGGKALLEQAAVRHRGHPGIPLAFSRLALLQGRFFDALACAQTAQKSNSESNLEPAVKRFYQIECLDALTAIELRRNQLEQAAQLAGQWQQQAPTSDKMFLANAEVLFRQDNLQQSVEFLNRRGDESKSDTPTEVIIAKWYQNKEDDVNYGKWIENAYQKFPDNSLTQLEYSAWLIRSEDFSKAKQIVEAYEKSNPPRAQSRMIQARIEFAEQNYSAAEKSFAALYQAQPGNFEHVYFLVLSMLESGDPLKMRQANQLAQRAFQSFPNNQLAMSMVGWSIYLTGDKGIGTQVLNEANNIGELLPDTAYFLAKTLADQQKNAEAKAMLAPFINAKSVFVFRNQARQLMQTISSADSLPNPGENNK